MTYELAKQLKDAGFPDNPFRKKDMCPCADCTVEKDGMWVCQCEKELFIQEPTLSNLIEECGGELVILRQLVSGEWQAMDCMYESSKYNRGAYVSCIGKTPEEAVAKLWLELNK